MLVIIDCGISNIRSVLNALDAIDVPSRIADGPADLRGADGVILPGVGAFGDGMASLHRHGYPEAIGEYVEEGKPVLGICLGMQLLASVSYEYGEHEGLGIVPGVVKRIETDSELRVPHVGWNAIDVHVDSPLFEGLSAERTFYFVHSFHLVADDPEVVTATTDYGIPLTACVQRDNVYGAQFHPEKSQTDGLRLLRNFAGICGIA